MNPTCKKPHFYVTLLYLSLMALLLVMMAAAGAKAEPQQTNAHPDRYPQKLWDPQVLRILIEGPGYLNPSLEFNLTPPPANNSPKTNKELALLQQYEQTTRSPATIALIKKEAAIGSFVDIYLNAPQISPALSKAAHHLLRLADRECRYFIVSYKKRFARPRPSHLRPALDLVVPNPGHAAYPSGHATQSMLFSKMLALIDPQNRAIYLDYAKAIAHRREIAGVHYPSDSLAGQQLAEALLPELLKIPAFLDELSLARHKFSGSR